MNSGKRCVTSMSHCSKERASYLNIPPLFCVRTSSHSATSRRMEASEEIMLRASGLA